MLGQGSDALKVLDTDIGLTQLDRSVGGSVIHDFCTPSAVNAYFNKGYWK